MARTLEQILQEMLGSQAFRIAAQASQLESAQEKIHTLEARIAELEATATRAA